MSGSDSSIPQLGDPFSAAASQQTAPGFLGQSPAFWQHLAVFGGNLVQSANARTPSGHLANGTGFGGAFGAAVGQTARDAQEQATNQANVGRSRAETTGLNLRNQLQAAQMPAELMRAQFQSGALQSPDLMSSLGYGGAPYSAPSFTQPSSNSAANFPANTPAFEAGVHQNESGGSMAPGIKGDGGQASGPMQIHPQALQDVGAATGINITPEQAAKYPELGKWAGDRYLQLQQDKFGPVGGVAAYNAGPGRLQQALNGQAPLPVSTVGYVQSATGQSGQPAGGPGDSYLQQAAALTARANRLAQAQATAKLVGLPPGPGMAMDPNVLHQQAAALTETGLKLNAAGPMKQAEADVELKTAGGIARQKEIGAGVKPITDRFGNMYQLDQTGKPVYLGRGGEVKEKFNPTSGNYEYGDVGGIGVGAESNLKTPEGTPPGTSVEGTVTAKPGPGKIGNLEAMPKIAQHFIEQDGKMVDEDLAHVIENVTPAKQALFQLRALNPDANTGAQGEFRANFKNWVQEFAPDFVSQITGDASPAQEFKKIALMGAGKQERGDLGARGGFRAIEMYANANPNLENTPTANHDMANALLISHQYHEDYAQGATNFFNNQYTNIQKSNSPESYQRVSNYDKEFIGKMRPELYASAITAMNGKPSTDWAKGLTPKQVQIVGGILQRTDPTAVIDMNGHQVPVNSFKSTFSPDDVMGAGGKSGG